MHRTCKNASSVIQLFIISTITLLCITLPAFSAENAVAETAGSLFGFIGDIITIIAITISELYFSYLHGFVVSLVSALWPTSWPQYEQMLDSYQSLFYTIPLWFTGNFWPTSWFGVFPRWGIDLFLATEIFYIALRLVTRKAAPFKGSWFSKFLKTMVYETWVFLKAPFFAARSVLFFLIRSEKEKRRTLLFWIYVTILTSIVVTIVAWFA